MIVELSEPGGSYPYENFVSNELQVQDVIPALKVTTKPGGVYIGVGPEQNFTYVAVLQSKLAFVIDIRRQNMLEMLMYKALFELSPDRADFVSRLFLRVRSAGVKTKTVRLSCSTRTKTPRRTPIFTPKTYRPSRRR